MTSKGQGQILKTLKLNISKRYESCIGSWMAEIFLTSDDHQKSKVKVKPLKLWSQISQKRYEIESIKIGRV